MTWFLLGDVEKRQVHVRDLYFRSHQVCLARHLFGRNGDLLHLSCFSSPRSHQTRLAAWGRGSAGRREEGSAATTENQWPSHSHGEGIGTSGPGNAHTHGAESGLSSTTDPAHSSVGRRTKSCPLGLTALQLPSCPAFKGM